jgi:predicted thioesterase
MSIDIGLKGRAESTVNAENTASAVGSGLVPVFATPYMVALMEHAAVNALLPYLAEGEGSVGTLLNVAHTAATPVGMKVWAEAIVTMVEGRKISFDVVAYDEVGQIGWGTHERAIIHTEKFLNRVQERASR